ncbi:MAG: hypothetical protein O7I93_08445 [Gemmatimonadetes bacterium]|nr:hypothetical protein [Gemmatimonadota bacterium]
MALVWAWLKRILEIGLLEFLTKLGWKWLGGLILTVVTLVAIVIVLILALIAILV